MESVTYWVLPIEQVETFWLEGQVVSALPGDLVVDDGTCRKLVQARQFEELMEGYTQSDNRGRWEIWEREPTG